MRKSGRYRLAVYHPSFPCPSPGHERFFHGKPNERGPVHENPDDRFVYAIYLVPMTSADPRTGRRVQE